jgi:hypothetical protein
MIMSPFLLRSELHATCHFFSASRFSIALMKLNFFRLRFLVGKFLRERLVAGGEFPPKESERNIRRLGDRSAQSGTIGPPTETRAALEFGKDLQAPTLDLAGICQPQCSQF